MQLVRITFEPSGTGEEEAEDVRVPERRAEVDVHEERSVGGIAEERELGTGMGRAEAERAAVEERSGAEIKSRDGKFVVGLVRDD